MSSNVPCPGVLPGHYLSRLAAVRDKRVEGRSAGSQGEQREGRERSAEVGLVNTRVSAPGQTVFDRRFVEVQYPQNRS
jgi:hypothetical protein